MYLVWRALGRDFNAGVYESSNIISWVYRERLQVLWNAYIGRGLWSIGKHLGKKGGLSVSKQVENLVSGRIATFQG
jgi:hypothetical protein